MKLTIKHWLLGVTLVIAAAWLIWPNHLPVASPPPRAVATVPEPIAVPPTVTVAESDESQKKALPVITDASPNRTRTEIESTHQMILAHSVLREPKIADPDSPENRVILQAMIAKALVRPASSAAP